MWYILIFGLLNFSLCVVPVRVCVCVNRNYNTVEGEGGGGGTNSHGACSPSAWKRGGRLVADDAAVIEVTWIPRVQPKARGMI